MSEKFTEGQEVYDINGQVFIYAAAVNGQHAAKPVYETGDGEPFVTCDAVIVRDLFAEPPLQKRHEKMASLDAQLEEKSSELMRIKGELIHERADHAAMLKRLKQHEALRRIDDFIEGRMTHVVTLEFSGVRIKPLSAMEKDGDRYDLGVRLMSLHGDSKGDLQWHVNRYKDDSGSWAEMWPCCSEGEALEKAAEVLAREFGTQENPGSGCTRMIASAVSLGLPVPQWVLDFRHAGVRAVVEDRIATLEKSLADERAKLEGIVGSAQ